MDKVLEITSNDHIIMIDKLCKRILGHPEKEEYQRYFRKNYQRFY